MENPSPKINVLTEELSKLEQELKIDGIQKIVLGAVIMRNELILLLVRAADEFMAGLVELPSGTLEKNEKLLEGLVREVDEETRLKILSIDAYAGSFDYLSGSGKKTRQLNFTVTVAPFDEVVVNPNEHESSMWIEPNSAHFASLNISPETKKIIDNCLKNKK